MNHTLRIALAAAAVATAFISVPGYAQAPVKKGEVPRPADTTANKPSESGAQTTTPPGAVTGAGQPQGSGQPAAAQARGSAKDMNQAKPTTSKTVKHKKSKKKHAKRRKAAASGTDASGAPR